MSDFGYYVKLQLQKLVDSRCLIITKDKWLPKGMGQANVLPVPWWWFVISEAIQIWQLKPVHKRLYLRVTTCSIFDTCFSNETSLPGGRKFVDRSYFMIHFLLGNGNIEKNCLLRGYYWSNVLVKQAGYLKHTKMKTLVFFFGFFCK